MKRIKEYLIHNPRKKQELESELLEAGINFYYIVSLMWERTTRKHTREFLIWKAQETLEIMMNNLPANIELEVFEQRIQEELKAIREDCGKNPDVIFNLLGAEIDNGKQQEIAFTFDFKVAIMIFLLETKEGISFDDLVAKYC